MIRAEDESRLASLRTTLAVANPLSTGDCRRLTEGFIACNVVMDLTWFFWQVVERRPGRIRGNLTYRDVHKFLAALLVNPVALHANPPVQPAQPHPIDVLVSPQVTANMDRLYGRRNPWRAIHLWMALEAVTRVLTGRGSRGAFQRATETFECILRQDRQTPVEFHDRGSAVSQAFDAWWKACADELTALLRTQLRDLLSVRSRRELARLLAIGLESSHLSELVKLTGLKNNRLTNCIGQVNKVLPRPNVPVGWLERTASEMLGARERQGTYQLGSADLRCLAKVIDWIIDNHFEDTVVWEISRPPRTAVSLRGKTLEQALGAWQDLCNLVRMRNLPPLRDRNQPPIRMAGGPPVRMRQIAAYWARSQPVRDLFSYPIRGSFRRWVIHARLYGLTASHNALWQAGTSPLQVMSDLSTYPYGTT